MTYRTNAATRTSTWIFSYRSISRRERQQQRNSDHLPHLGDDNPAVLQSCLSRSVSKTQFVFQPKLWNPDATSGGHYSGYCLSLLTSSPPPHPHHPPYHHALTPRGSVVLHTSQGPTPVVPTWEKLLHTTSSKHNHKFSRNLARPGGWWNVSKETPLL